MGGWALRARSSAGCQGRAPPSRTHPSPSGLVLGIGILGLRTPMLRRSPPKALVEELVLGRPVHLPHAKQEGSPGHDPEPPRAAALGQGGGQSPLSSGDRSQGGAATAASAPCGPLRGGSGSRAWPAGPRLPSDGFPAGSLPQESGRALTPRFQDPVHQGASPLAATQGGVPASPDSPQCGLRRRECAAGAVRRLSAALSLQL